MCHGAIRPESGEMFLECHLDGRRDWIGYGRRSVPAKTRQPPISKTHPGFASIHPSASLNYFKSTVLLINYSCAGAMDRRHPGATYLLRAFPNDVKGTDRRGWLPLHWVRTRLSRLAFTFELALNLLFSRVFVFRLLSCVYGYGSCSDGIIVNSVTVQAGTSTREEGILTDN